MKTIDITNVYNVLNTAKLNKMEDKDKFTVIRALRQLKPVRQGYEEAVKDAQERLKPEGWDELQKRAADWNATHRDKKLADLAPEEREELEGINAAYRDYAAKVEGCVKDLAEKEVEASYARLTEDAFGKLLEGNPDWEAGTVMLLMDVLVES